MFNDYRNTKYCPSLRDLDNKKQQLQQLIEAEHPRAKNMYKAVSQKKGPYKRRFLDIYNKKCVYCGNSLDNISIDMFEVDHYINKSSIADQGIANNMQNLVAACQVCNRGKHDFTISDQYKDILHPEKTEITKVFIRNQKYQIEISEKYKTHKEIIDYYKRLKLDRETRRLDFLLLNMRGLYQSVKDKQNLTIENGLSETINLLQRKRNLFTD